MIQTVTGPIDAKDLGAVLVHEHLFIDLRSHWQPMEPDAGVASVGTSECSSIGACRRNPFETRDNLLLDDVDVAIAEVAHFKALGGTTIVDLTPPDIGRNPLALRSVATATGVHVVCGTGYYIHLTHPASIADADVSAVAARFLEDLQSGIDDTGVRAGVIGEVGTSNPVHADEEKVLRAAARAQREAHVPIVVHLSPPPRNGWWQAHQVLDLLEREGAHLSHVLLAHIDNMLVAGEDLGRALDYQRELVRRGCFLGYDGFGKDHYFPAGGATPYPSFWCPSDQLRASAIASLTDEDFDSHLIVSHDVCFKVELAQFGGFGYGYLLKTVPRILGDYGIGRDKLDGWLVDNPARLFAGAW